MKELLIQYLTKKIDTHKEAELNESDHYKKGYHQGSIKSYEKVLELVQNQK